ncbi:MAG: type II toxin-antitoxin system RelE/ParE family toxin [Proteobacteria bacterium]|nr:type II toxin-antitoxin system RelE/ParE family toxin [Pseudomonadota bacterium]
MAEYTLKKLAEIDFEKIWHYTAKEWGTTQAIKYTNELEKVFSFLANNPLDVS